MKLKKIIALLSSMFLLQSMPVSADSYITGDVNKDGKITNMDLLLGKLYILGQVSL